MGPPLLIDLKISSIKSTTLNIHGVRLNLFLGEDELVIVHVLLLVEIRIIFNLCVLLVRSQMHSWINHLVVIGFLVVVVHEVTQRNHASVRNAISEASSDDAPIKLVVYLPIKKTFSEILWRIF